MSKDDIDEDLSDARERMTKLLAKGRHNQILLRKIKVLQRLVKLRDQLLARRTFAMNERKENVGPEFDQLSRPNTEVLDTNDERKKDHVSTVSNSPKVWPAPTVTERDTHRDNVKRVSTDSDDKSCCTLL